MACLRSSVRISYLPTIGIIVSMIYNNVKITEQKSHRHVENGKVMPRHALFIKEPTVMLGLEAHLA